MAAAPQHRGGLLTRRRLLLLVGALLAAAAAAAWFSQAALLSYVARSRSGGALALSGASGNMVDGFTLTKIVVEAGAAKVAVERVFIRPDLAALFRGKVVIAELNVSTPSVALSASPRGEEAGASGLPEGLPEISSAVITGGSLILPDGRAAAERLRCRLAFTAGLLRVEKCSADMRGASVLFSGSWDGDKADISGRAEYAPERVSAGFKYGSSGKRHSLSASGAWGQVPLKVKAGVSGEEWELEISATGRLPLSRVKRDLRDLTLSAGLLSASGRGFSPDSATGSGSFSAESGVIVSSGAFTFSHGDYGADVYLSSGPLSAAAAVKLSGGVLSGGWALYSDGELALPGDTALLVRGLRSSGTISGTALAPAADGTAEIPGFAAGGVSGGTVTLDFEARAGENKYFRFNAAAAEVMAGERRAQAVTASAKGTPESHVFGASVVLGEEKIAVSGSASLRNDSWSASVTGIELPEYGWALCGPFSLSVSPGGSGSIKGFCLASGRGRINISAGLRSAALAELRASIVDLDLSWLETLGITDLRPEGRLNAEAQYSAGSPGGFKLNASEMKLNGLGMGELSASGAFQPDGVDLEEAQWRLYGGSVKASGAASRANGAVTASFSVTASTADISPLLAFFPGWEAREAWFSGNGSVILEKEELKTTGALYLNVPQLSSPAMGLAFDDVGLEIGAGDISSARLRASAVRKGGRVSAAGIVSASGPEVRIVASAFPFSHPSGLSAKASAQLLLAGRWKEPSLTGNIDLVETRFEMKKWNKFVPAEERSGFYESLGMDLRINAEKNAWYRDGVSSVEVKAGLFFKKEPYQAASLLGTVETLRGNYVYLGKTFVLNSGRITFTGENPPDPAISAEASMGGRGAPYTVYFSASGTMRTPKVSLTSDPSMEQRDIISYMVTGKPLYELNSQGKNGARSGNDNGMAQNLAAGYISQQAAATVGSKLDLDVINLKMTNESHADITVGRYVTKDLFVSYGQVLGQGGEKRVSAEYSVTKHLSLEGKNTSDGHYTADLLFKFGIR